MKTLFWEEELPEEIGNKYLAVNISAKRARQLADGTMATVRIAGRKATTVALEEMFTGMLEYQAQLIEGRRFVPQKSVADPADGYDIPDTILSSVDRVFKKGNVDEVSEKEEEKDVLEEEEEVIFESEYVDDSDYYYDDDDEYEEGI